MDYNVQELLQMIGQMHVDRTRLGQILQQQQELVKQKDDEILTLKAEIQKSQTTISEFKAVAKTDG